EFAEARKCNRARVLPGARRKIGAEPSQIFFDFAAYSLRSSGAHHRRSHIGKAGRNIGDGGVAGAETKIAVETRDGMRFDENNFEAVCEFRFDARRPIYGTLRGKRGHGT